MVVRIWHGYTTPENADAYFHVLTTEVIPGIADMKIPGYRSIEVLRRPLGEETEFITIMRSDSLDNVKAFVGVDSCGCTSQGSHDRAGPLGLLLSSLIQYSNPLPYSLAFQSIRCDHLVACSFPALNAR